VLGGREGSEILYVVDFGLARMYVDEHNRHLPFEQQNFAGTAHYASLNAHLKRAQSRRDDLESLGFLLIYFLEGSLPWHGLKAASKRERRKLIGTMKLKTTIKELCKGHPEEFERYFDYVRSLDFADRPDYHFLRTIFRNLFRAKGFKYDYKYDWTLKRESYSIPFISPKIMVVPTKKYQRRSADRVRHMQRIRGLQEEADRKRYERMEQERIVMAANKKPSPAAAPAASAAAAAAFPALAEEKKKDKKRFFGTRRGKDKDSQKKE
jgi:serine/threonine protein kinase